MKRFGFLLAVALLPMMVMAQSTRKEVQLAEGWRFSRENEAMKSARAWWRRNNRPTSAGDWRVM